MLCPAKQRQTSISVHIPTPPTLNKHTHKPDNFGNFQVEELQNKRPLVPADLRLPPQQQEVMDTFRTAMVLGPKALGAYVISMASSPSDVLTVVLLQKTAATTIARCAHFG